MGWLWVAPPPPSLFDNTIKGNYLLYSRYMDDIVCSIKKTNIEKHLQMINNLHPSLLFTYEVEINGKLAFLDMNICINNGFFVVSLVKETH